MDLKYKKVKVHESKHKHEFFKIHENLIKTVVKVSAEPVTFV
jgi:hypothetical protein